MKNESQVFKMIIDFIERDPNIVIAILNGSRVNPNAPKDFMQDYDIALYVNNLDAAQKYKENQNWVSHFGDLVILQQNDFEESSFIFLLQYTDCLRIDLSFHHINIVNKKIKEDSLSKIIYDRNKIIGEIPDPNESSYFVQKPSEKRWNETLNNIWWLQVYISKELWRNELPLAKELYDVWVMNHLRDLITWSIGAENNWSVNVGHGGKWFKRLLSSEIYNKYIYFYSSADKDEQWEKILNIGGFIREIGEPLCKKLGYEYPITYDINVTKYIRRIYNLPTDAISL